MKSVGEQLLQRAKKLKTELLIVHKALLEVADVEEQNVPAFPVDSYAAVVAKSERTAPLAELRAEIFRLSLEASSDEWRTAREAAEPWRRARLALRNNPDAELPA